MKKVFYILFIALLALGFASCSNNSDEPTPPPPPPTTGRPDTIPPLDLFGEWEGYYSSKALISNPGTSSQMIYPGFRLIALDGFRTEFFDDGTVHPQDSRYKYRFRTKNPIGEQIELGYFCTRKDSVLFKWKSHYTGIDTTTWRRASEVNTTKGIIKWDRTYDGRTKDGTKFKVTDAYAYRNVKTAPAATDGVNPAKVVIDFPDMSTGSWQIENCRYYNPDLNVSESVSMTRILQGTKYKFYKEGNTPRCIMTSKDSEGNEVQRDHRLVIIDDVINFIPIYDGVEVGDKSFYMWVTSWGGNKYIDLKQTRYDQDVTIFVKYEFDVLRVDD
ncbi:hypothetical protein M2451_000116 [Dysgonomonas sp. PFB1-18]|uniref:hypothetical protein n=1 Tax=unclassified Dysgonomonas TaxID=2630389 RepID=UPI00247644BE|nr:MULTISPECIES: hypothetical protein [unclassified Dysgonomonas]MDH6307667.1 hypothetical protein [Dysgonomonas sp. PF1-14]MDH6337585.1 hypothetical protein [Dysgonomonas sp. PF1-16]MDH6378809.1 hypothetical protein [Dysgonomonas sp. PFB1-18]MDH6396444.1 hypothetical protein [Dysgonomonas sp. PF1-23]